MKDTISFHQRKNPYYYTIRNKNSLINIEIIKNIKKLHNMCKDDQKSNILSIIAYDEIKKDLRNTGFKFSESQFKIAKNKRLNNTFTLNSYKRHIPESKRKVSIEEIEKIITYLDKYSKLSTNENEKIRYLEQTKKFIYEKYIENTENRKMTYNTFIKYIPKYYKDAKRKTDMCGICEIGKNFNNISTNKLNNEEKIKLENNKIIHQKHIKVVENQKNHYNLLKEQLSENECIVVLDFKENFKLSHAGNELSYDYYNKRQVSCLGVSLIYKKENNTHIEYVAYLSNILNHDSLFTGDVLEQFLNELDTRFSKVNIFTDCGPHFRSREFICTVKKMSKLFNRFITLNFFSEYHGKSIVDGFFGHLSKAFKIINYKNDINTVNELKEEFEKHFIENGYWGVHFRIYTRDDIKRKISKIVLKNLKHYLSYKFKDGLGYYSYIACNDPYTLIEDEDTEEVDKRKIKLTPKRTGGDRMRTYYNNKIKKTLDMRIT